MLFHSIKLISVTFRLAALLVADAVFNRVRLTDYPLTETEAFDMNGP